MHRGVTYTLLSPPTTIFEALRFILADHTDHTAITPHTTPRGSKLIRMRGVQGARLSKTAVWLCNSMSLVQTSRHV